MMAVLSLAWWAQKLSGVAVQAAAIVAIVGLIAGGLAWLRHDAVLQERQAAAVKMEKARNAQLLILRRRERDAGAVGARAEKALLEELDALTALNNNLEAKLASRPTRVIVYPKAIVRELNR